MQIMHSKFRHHQKQIFVVIPFNHRAPDGGAELTIIPYTSDLPGLPLGDIPDALVRVRPRRVEHAVPVGPLVRVPPEVIPLGLRQVRGQRCPPVRIEVIQRPRQRRRRDAVPDRHDHDPPPRRGSVVHLRGDDRIEEEIRQLRVAVQRVLDLLQESRADDAPPLPQPGAFAEVDTPIHVVARGLDYPETLGVRAHLRGVQCRFQVVEELPLVHGYLGTGHLEEEGGGLGSGSTVVFANDDDDNERRRRCCCSSPRGVLVDDVKGTTTRMGAISRRRVSAVAIIRRVIVVVVEAATIDVVASRSVLTSVSSCSLALVP